MRSEMSQCLSEVKALFCSKCFYGGGVGGGGVVGGIKLIFSPYWLFFFSCFCFMQGSFYHMVVTDCLS